MLFVSHNMAACRRLCSRAVLLDEGRLLKDGSVSSVLESYARLIGERGHERTFETDPSLPAAIVSAEIANGDGTPTASFDLTDEIVITIRYEVREAIQGLQLTVTLSRNLVDVVTSFDTDALPETPDREPGTYEAVYRSAGDVLEGGLLHGARRGGNARTAAARRRRRGDVRRRGADGQRRMRADTGASAPAS